MTREERREALHRARHYLKESDNSETPTYWLRLAVVSLIAVVADIVDDDAGEPSTSYPDAPTKEEIKEAIKRGKDASEKVAQIWGAQGRPTTTRYR